MSHSSKLAAAVAGALLLACGQAAAPTTPNAPPPAAHAAFVGATPLRMFEKWRVDRPEAPPIDVYVAHDGARKPLVVYVQGSKCLPVFMKGDHRLMATIPNPHALAQELSRVHFAVIERRGLTSFGPPPADEAAARDAARCTPSHGGVSKVERVADVVDTVRALAAEPWVDGVSVVGHSEGADVAAGAGHALAGSIRGVGLLSGAGITRFFDSVVEDGGEDAVKAVLDDEIAITGDHPPADYAGAAVTRQITYAVDSTPLDDLRDVPIPVFVAAGTRDDKSPALSAHAFVAELLRERARAVTYVILPGLDHDYVDDGGHDRFVEVLHAFVDWSLGARDGRSVVVRRL